METGGDYACGIRKSMKFRFVRKLAKAQNVPRKNERSAPGFWYDLVSLPDLTYFSYRPLPSRSRGFRHLAL